MLSLPTPPYEVLVSHPPCVSFSSTKLQTGEEGVNEQGIYYLTVIMGRELYLIGVKVLFSLSGDFPLGT